MAARLCAAACVLACHHPLAAQSTGSAELDPTAPLDPLPDLGVDWPDMKANPIEEPSSPSAEPAQAAPSPIGADEQRRYSLLLEGIAGVDDEPALVKAFDAQSALREGGGEAANAAQIDRRSRADAELLAELLRSRGYYDAVVEPRIEAAGQALTIVLTAQPGRQYTFQSVELPGLDAAGEDASRL